MEINYFEIFRSRLEFQIFKNAIYLLVITKGAVFFRARGGMGNTIYLLDFVRETMVREWRGGRECSPGQKYHVFSGFFSSPSAVGEGVFEDFPACGAAICKISRMSIAVDFSLSLERASQNCIGYPLARASRMSRSAATSPSAVGEGVFEDYPPCGAGTSCHGTLPAAYAAISRALWCVAFHVGG